VLKWGTGGINIDGCRVGTNGETPKGSGNPCKNAEKSAIQPGRSGGNGGNETPPQGRFPANLIHDGSQEVLDLFPETKPSKSGGKTSRTGNGAKYGMGTADRTGHDDQGSAARFFYCPKASKKDRNEGCEELEDGQPVGGADKWTETDRKGEGVTRQPSKNTHPTVKPTALMSYLCRLITPTNGVVLDPYMGSGSTGKAAVREGFSFVGIELDPDYYEICKARIIK
jgi:site-specific DNA-methyltransferase (adenine-specific)